MNFITYGDKRNKALLFLHGMATTAMQCYAPLLPYLTDYYVVLCEVDGHSDSVSGDFVSIEDSCNKIAQYVANELGGEVYGLCGLSMGGTLAVELIGRGMLTAQRVLLDAAFTVKMGIMTKPFTAAFCSQISKMQRGGSMSRLLSDCMMGKGNSGVAEMLYMGISQTTLKNACRAVYTYDIPEGLSAYEKPVMFWRGAREPYPKRSARILKKYLPQMQETVFPEMGHTQYLHDCPAEYARGLIEFTKVAEPLL